MSTTDQPAPPPTVEPPPGPWWPPSPLPEACETQRLVLRYWRPEDAPGMLAALDAGRASYLPYLPWVSVDNLNLPQCIYQIERFRRDRERPPHAADDFVLGIFDRHSGEALGGTGLHRVNRAAHQAEIGYWVRPDRRRAGLCTEAVSALLAWAFRPQPEGGWGLRRIEIVCAGSNAPSQSVPRRLGLREEARLRGHRWVPGIGWDDTLIWGALASEWGVTRGDAPPG